MTEEEKTPGRSRAFADLLEEPVTPEEEAILAAKEKGVEAPEKARKMSPLEERAETAEDPNDIPDWVIIPEGFKFPKGRQVAFMLFRPEITVCQTERQCVLWSLSVSDEKLARKRTRGDSQSTFDELAKQTIRLIDGVKVDWTGKASVTKGPGSIDKFYEDIGPQYRQMILNAYHKTHTLSLEQQADFFLNCFVVRTAVG